MAMHAPIMGAVNVARPFKLTTEERAAAERSIEALIALLDAADGDPDLEEDDPSGDPLEAPGEHPSDGFSTSATVRPVYGINQARGPLKRRSATQEHQA